MRACSIRITKPICRVFQKHFRSFESLREHVRGPLPNAKCEKIFKKRGCDYYNRRYALQAHKDCNLMMVIH
ncbi:hypothetical protein CASFOL_042150 [Castilleja foliolosa]|uniref:C2H2-type domain-containing protein n=1 Tax=Castilleja foliolosa TaxID=1961234 RepID=A0ABD3B9M9_9LAMI